MRQKSFSALTKTAKPATTGDRGTCAEHDILSQLDPLFPVALGGFPPAQPELAQDISIHKEGGIRPANGGERRVRGGANAANPNSLKRLIGCLIGSGRDKPLLNEVFCGRNTSQAGVNKLRVLDQIIGQRTVENFLGSFQANGSIGTIRKQIKGVGDNSAIDVDTPPLFSRISKKLVHVLRIRATEMSMESIGVFHIADRAAQVRAAAARGCARSGPGR